MLEPDGAAFLCDVLPGAWRRADPERLDRHSLEKTNVGHGRSVDTWFSRTKEGNYGHDGNQVFRTPHRLRHGTGAQLKPSGHHQHRQGENRPRCQNSLDEILLDAIADRPARRWHGQERPPLVTWWGGRPANFERRPAL